jgi:predicted RNase H-like HicB family nuclease
MAKVTYVAFLDARDAGFAATFPDLPGCASWGQTQDEAVRNAETELSIHLECLAADGRQRPAASPLQTLTGDMVRRHFAGLAPTIYAMITVEAPEEGERVNVYLPKSLLERVDWFSRAAGLNRSGFFGLAARNYMGDFGRRGPLDRHQAAALRAELVGTDAAVAAAQQSSEE